MPAHNLTPRQMSRYLYEVMAYNTPDAWKGAMYDDTLDSLWDAEACDTDLQLNPFNKSLSELQFEQWRFFQWQDEMTRRGRDVLPSVREQASHYTHPFGKIRFDPQYADISA
jgi:hypothetical protein